LAYLADEAFGNIAIVSDNAGLRSKPGIQ